MICIMTTTDAPRPPPVRGSTCVSDNDELLSAALIAFGAAFCLIYPLAIFWPSGWAWHEGSPASNDYFLMIVGVYATLGGFMILAAKRPEANASLISLVVWSSASMRWSWAGNRRAIR